MSPQTLRPEIDHSRKSDVVRFSELYTAHPLLITHRRGLGPGADSLTRALTNPALPTEQRVDVKQKIKDLTVADWVLIVRAFDNWPFAPEVRHPAPCPFVSLLNVGFGTELDHLRRVPRPSSRSYTVVACDA